MDISQEEGSAEGSARGGRRREMEKRLSKLKNSRRKDPPSERFVSAGAYDGGR